MGAFLLSYKQTQAATVPMISTNANDPMQTKKVLLCSFTKLCICNSEFYYGHTTQHNITQHRLFVFFKNHSIVPQVITFPGCTSTLLTDAFYFDSFYNKKYFITPVLVSF